MSIGFDVPTRRAGFFTTRVEEAPRHQPEGEALTGRRAYEKHVLPTMWARDLEWLRTSDPDLVEDVD